MQRAIELARRGLGRTTPNPAVGAVIVNNHVVVGEGFHPQAGKPHAEIFALQQAGGAARGADVYVTLEPCSHFGRTPPCVDALMVAGVARVFVGAVDPDPRVSGAGIAALQQAGIDVEVGLCQEECLELIEGFAKMIRCGRPFTTYKAAMTLDGCTATADGDSQWISGEQSRLRVHHLRNRADAIMVGIETILKDDPRLTVRLPQQDGRDPLRVVVDSRLRMPLTSRMLQQVSQAATLIATGCDDPQRISQLQQLGAEVVVLPLVSGRVTLPALWDELGRRQVQHLLLEGGSTLATAALEAGLIDRLMVFIAPKLAVGCPSTGLFAGKGCSFMSESTTLHQVNYEKVGEDLLVTGMITPCLPV